MNNEFKIKKNRLPSLNDSTKEIIRQANSEIPEEALFFNKISYYKECIEEPSLEFEQYKKENQ